MSDQDDGGVDTGEAEAQREETIMPWIWGAFGIVLIAVFVAWVLLSASSGHVVRHPPGAAPIFKPPGQSY